jgi:type IV secretory pathway VirB4 component
LETGQILKKTEKKRSRSAGGNRNQSRKRAHRDPALEVAYQDLETLRDRLQTAQERMFKVGLYLTVYADEEKQLRESRTLFAQSWSQD